VTHPLWPPLDLRLTTGDLELRLPREDELPAFSEVIAQGIHPPDEMPFGLPWTREPSPARERSSYQWWMSARGNWKPEDWTLTLGVWENAEAAGYQDLVAQDFAALRTVRTGSWLGQRFQRRGIGRQMRLAVLALAFDHLGAEIAESEAFVDTTLPTESASGSGTSRTASASSPPTARGEKRGASA
jgi:RimJ/RimL family protein N-acetyltransferase